MKRKIFTIVAMLTLSVLLLPIHAFAFGGFVSTKGSSVYHDIYCDLLEGYSISELKWYDTAEQAEAAGLTACEECDASNGFDFTYDIETTWKTSDHLIQSAMEIEYENGLSYGYHEGYEVGFADGKTNSEYEFYDSYGGGYSEGYEDGENYGYDKGYDDGFAAGKEKARYELQAELEEEYNQKVNKTVSDARMDTAIICIIIFGVILYFIWKKKES